MYFNKILLLLFVFVVISCSKKAVNNNEVKTIVLKESKDILPISSFIGEIDYLELLASEANIEIKEIQDVKVIDGDIIIKQRKAGEISFIRFAKNGDFICEIVNNSNGKVLHPLDLIKYQKDYAVLSEEGIHVVSKNGKYKGKLISSEMNGSVFFSTTNRFYVINEAPSSNFLSEYSNSKSPVSNAKLDKRLENLIYTDLAVQGKSSYYLVSSFCDTIFSYSNNKLVPKYYLAGENYPTLSEVWQNVGERDSRETLRYIYDTQHILVKNYLENKELIFMTYGVGSSTTTVIIKKKNWETQYYARAVNDIDGGIWDKAFYLSDNNELYVPISAYKINGHKISNKWHKDFEKIQLHIAASGNPVIMRCKLK